jgi:hypothetical protein
VLAARERGDAADDRSAERRYRGLIARGDGVENARVVGFDREATLAREQFSELAEEVREALSDPEVRRQASLSRASRDRLSDAETGDSGTAPDRERDAEADRQQSQLGSF